MSNSYRLTSPVAVIGDGGSPGLLNLSDGTNSVRVQAPVGLSGDVDFVLPNTDGTSGQFLMRNGGTVWTSIIQHNPNSGFPMYINTVDPATKVSAATTSNTFEPVAYFLYRGTAVENTISAVKAIVSNDFGGTFGQIQLQDITNGPIILTSPTFGPVVGGSIEQANLGIPTGLPAGEAVIEVQLRKAMGSGEIKFLSLQIYS